MTTSSDHNTQRPVDTVIHGNCIDVMHGMEANSVDMILTDPPTSRATARATARR
jgi:DNA modification methylase